MLSCVCMCMYIYVVAIWIALVYRHMPHSLGRHWHRVSKISLVIAWLRLIGFSTIAISPLGSRITSRMLSAPVSIAFAWAEDQRCDW